ncbi:MAG: hypothetical protein J6P71_02495 [Oscillospiraceae bacterium]|nr:hypothetical protein [Oscillospiraceae bacterium]
MSVFILKLLAMATMLVDHIGYRLAGNPTWMRVAGRTAFILYAFMMAESCFQLRDKPKRLLFHAVKLALLVLVTEVPHDLFARGTALEWGSQNVILTLLLGFLALTACGLMHGKNAAGKAAAAVGSVLICALAAFLAWLTKAEYSCAGVVLVVLVYLYLRRADDMSAPARVAALIGVFAAYFAIYTWTYASFGGWAAAARVLSRQRWWYLGMALPLVPAALYNRKRGPDGRWFRVVYSLFYPAHMLALYLIARYVL